MTWRLDIRPGEGMYLLNVILCQDAWRALTLKSRAALLALADNAGPVHPLSLRSLQSHGLVDENGAVTEVGRRVVRHRPNKTGGQS